MSLPLKRLHLFEITDEPWYCYSMDLSAIKLFILLTSSANRFPTFLRTCVQDALTRMWGATIPPIHIISSASRVARILQEELGSENLQSYTFVDSCAGAGGPTPYIEAEVNADIDDLGVKHNKGVEFILTDLFPHPSAWLAAAKASRTRNLRYVPIPVDATTMTKDVIDLAQPPRSHGEAKETKLCRLFNLAFHHFDDELAIQILRHTLDTCDAVAIFELQGRDVGSILTVLMLFPILWLRSWKRFRGQWTILFWYAILPVVPFVVVFDGIVSCLRTRKEEEIYDLIERAGGKSRNGTSTWRFRAGRKSQADAMGVVNYFIGEKG